MNLKPLTEQVVVVMGASSGIGRETALRFGRAGARVVVAARSADSLEALAEEIRRQGGQAVAVTADTAVFEQVKAVADRAVEAFGRLDTWVHVAGVGLWARFEETTPEEWARVIDVNLNGQAYGAMAALPHLRRAGGGALIHVSSVEALLALPYQSAYGASKHGIHAFLRALRLELKKEGVPISVTEVMPNGTDTPLFDQGRTRIGVKPRPFAPVYEPSVTAEAILRAAEHPVEEVVAGSAGVGALMLNRLTPKAYEAFMLKMGFRMQETEERKPDTAPSNLFRPLGTSAIPGSFDGMTRRNSLYTWLELRPAVKQGLLLAAVGGLALLAGAGRRRGRAGG